MTPEAEAGFRSLLSLLDIAADDNPEGIFSSLIKAVAWSFRQSERTQLDGKPNSDLDAMLNGLQEHTSLWMGLLPHLATVDRDYFHLAKRMAARTLVRHTAPALLYRQMAAALLVSEPPRRSKPKAARDALIVIGIAVLQQTSVLPTESYKTTPMTRSGCGRISKELHDVHRLTVTYDAIEKVWKNKRSRLHAAGFTEQQASDFLSFFSPMK